MKVSLRNGSLIKYGMTIIILLLFLITTLESQTYLPKAYYLNYKGIYGRLDSLPLPDFKVQPNFTISWHWSMGKTLGKNLNFSQTHWFIDYDSVGIDDVQPNTRRISNIPYFAKRYGELELHRGKAIVFEPTYRVDTIDPYNNFIPRTGDTTRYAAGFKNVKGYIASSTSDPNFDRLQLFQSQLDSGIVLSNNWPPNEYSTIIKVDETDQHNIINEYSRDLYQTYKPDSLLLKRDSLMAVDWKGVNNYLNINLRRLDTTDVAMNNDTILAIRLPFETFQIDSFVKFANTRIILKNRITGYIRFDSIPNDTVSKVFNLANNRGLIRQLKLKKNNSEIFITRKMLPPGNATTKDITLSAWFICDRLIDSVNRHNYGLNNFQFEDKNKTIENLKIEVKYFDNCDVGIDWISINNRASREVSFGNLDTVLKKFFEHSISIFTNPTYTSRGINLYRWYLMDEPTETSDWYFRYYVQRLFGHVFTQEAGFPSPQFHYYCEPPENWVGLGKFTRDRTNPYFKFHGSSSELNYARENANWPRIACYSYNYDTTFHSPSSLLNSQYETAINHYDNLPFNYAKDNNIDPANNDYDRFGLQFEVESFEFRGLLDPRINQYLFNGTKWWGQIWNDAYYDATGLDTNKPRNGLQNWYGIRNTTGEEMRMLLKRTVLFGAKGIVIDGEFMNIGRSRDTETREVNIINNLHHGQRYVNDLGYSNLDSWEFLEKNEIGGDFLDINDQYDSLARWLDLGNISKFMGIDSTRYYVGRKSNRREFKKVSEFIRSQDTLLMRLQLIAAYSKGFTETLIHDNKVGDTIFTKFVNKNNTKSRPLNRVRPYYEQEGWDNSTNNPIDSGFYNITLLKDTAQLNMDSVFYLGVLNKRTGPHLHLDSAEAGGKLDSISFITTAELDSLADCADSLKWRKYFWKRLGTREITLFFNDSTFDRTTKILKVSELGNSDSDSVGYWNWNYWRKENYNNRLITTIYPNQPLKVKLLPGDGRMLKIESKDLTPADTTCECDKVIPKTVLDIKRPIDSSCYTMEIEVYPCPNKVMDSLRIKLLTVPPCFKKRFGAQIFKNDSLIKSGVIDITTDTIFTLPTSISSNDGKVILKVRMCPELGPPYCPVEELDKMSALLSLTGADCPNYLDVISSVKLDNFNQDFNKFFQNEFNNFSIVPNPATSYIDLSFETPLSINSKVYIVDEQGRILKERLITADSNEKLTIDVNQLSNGTYFIAVYDKDKLIKGKPFLIMK